MLMHWMPDDFLAGDAYRRFWLNCLDWLSRRARSPVVRLGILTLYDPLALTRALLAFPTLNPPGGEEACAQFLVTTLREAGFHCELQRFGERRCNLVAWLPGRGPGKPLGFTGHLDVVPLGNGIWRYGPFTGEVTEGRLYGRGASDMKAGIAAFIVACHRNREVIAQGPGVRLLLTGGEETGCDGARALCRDAPHLLGELGALLVGEPTANRPVLGHKGAFWLRCTAHGRTAHGAMPRREKTPSTAWPRPLARHAPSPSARHIRSCANPRSTWGPSAVD